MGVSLDTMWQSLGSRELASFKASIANPDINIKDKNRLGTTILHRYAHMVDSLKYNPEEIVSLLIQNGMDINSSTNKIGH